MSPSTNRSKAEFKIANPSDGPQLTHNQINFMKLLEKENVERVRKLRLTQKRNLVTGWTLGLTVLSIYAFSMFSIKQETFLNDFEEPKTVIKNTNSDQ